MGNGEIVVSGIFCISSKPVLYSVIKISGTFFSVIFLGFGSTGFFLCHSYSGVSV